MIDPELRRLFHAYDEEENAQLSFEGYGAAFRAIENNEKWFLFANIVRAAYFLKSSRTSSSSEVYAFNNGLKETSHIPVGKGSPFKRILDTGKQVQMLQ